MKYVRRVNNRLFYERDYPMRLQPIIGRKIFTSPLGDAGQSESQLLRAVSSATEVYQVKVKMATNSDPAAFTDAELGALVKKMLASKGLTEGQLIRDYPVDPEITALELENHEHNELLWKEHTFGDDAPAGLRPEHLQMTPQDVAEEIFHDDMIDDQHRRRRGLPQTPKQKAAGLTYRAALEVRKRQPTWLSEIWEPYAASLVNPIRKTVWNRYLLITGDQRIDKDSDRTYLNRALRNYRDARRSDSLRESSITRELGTIVACLNYTSEENDILWNIKKPRAKSEPQLYRPVINQNEQIKLVGHCMAGSNSQIGAVVSVLLGLHGGLIKSEIARMNFKVQLDCLHAAVPHVLIAGETKTQARARYVPILYGLDVIRDGIEQAIKLNQHPERCIWQVRKVLMEGTGNSYPPYSLRHSFKSNCVDHGVPYSDICLLGGWKTLATSDNQVMMGYGQASAGSYSRLIKLAESQKLGSKHLVQFFD